MKNFVRNALPKKWLREWGIGLLKAEGNTIIKVDSDLMILSTIHSSILVKEHEIQMEPGSALKLIFTENAPITVSFYPPLEIKI